MEIHRLANWMAKDAILSGSTINARFCADWLEEMGICLHPADEWEVREKAKAIYRRKIKHEKMDLQRHTGKGNRSR